MFLKQLSVSLVEFGLTVIMSVLVVFVTYRAMAVTNPDYDTEDELQKGNVAVGIVVGSIFVGTGIAIGLVIGMGLN